ncbi:MAG: serine/threonine protein kinase, partial [Chloroflexota bacterium]
MRFSDSLIGKQLANFRIDRLLGRGGMAKVYQGWDIKLDRPVAIKVIDERYRSEPSYGERFLREARAVAALQHPNIVHIYHAGEQDGLLYFVMKYVRGVDLKQWMKQYRDANKLIPEAEVVRIGRAVAGALDYAHAQGVIHRDVKPSNILVAENGQIILTDFGLAMNVMQETMGDVFGSPQYISPEQARKSSFAVPQSDLYSLGIILYEMLAGRLPFDDPSPATLALQHITAEPPSPRSLNPRLNRVVEAVLLKALSKTPGQRYQTGRELMDALEAALKGDKLSSSQPVTILFLPLQTETRPTRVASYDYETGGSTPPTGGATVVGMASPAEP